MTITAIEASDIRRLENMLREWMGKRNSYHPNELPSHIVPPTNKERSKLELFEFMRDKPDRYFVYVTRDKSPNALRPWKVATWMGDLLGHNLVVGDEYTSNMGDKRRSIWFDGINGERYSGTFFCSAGDYARIRKVRK